MNCRTFLVGTSVTAALAQAQNAPAAPLRRVYSLNRNWLFQPNFTPGADAPAFNDSGCRRVTLPHTNVDGRNWNNPEEVRRSSRSSVWCWMGRAFVGLILGVTTLMGQTAGEPTWKEFSIRPVSKRGNSDFNAPKGYVRSDGEPLALLLAQIERIPEVRIVGPDWLTTQFYAMRAALPDEWVLRLRPRDSQEAADREFESLLDRELTRRFHLVRHRETRDIPVYVLQPIEGTPPKLQPSDSSERQLLSVTGRGFTGHGSVKGTNTSITPLLNWLPAVLKRPVIDESGVSSPPHYNFHFSYQNGNVPSLLAAVKEQLGLQLVEDRRKLEVLVVEHAEKIEASR